MIDNLLSRKVEYREKELCVPGRGLGGTDRLRGFGRRRGTGGRRVPLREHRRKQGQELLRGFSPLSEFGKGLDHVGILSTSHHHQKGKHFF